MGRGLTNSIVLIERHIAHAIKEYHKRPSLRIPLWWVTEKEAMPGSPSQALSLVNGINNL
jgi:hypothetical protein